MNEALLTQAQRLYSEAREIVAEEVWLKRQSGRHVVRLASILKDLYETFLQREDPREGLVLIPRRKGFANFKECMLELLRPLDLQERSGWYFLSIGRHLLGKIPEAELGDMPFEKVKQLARVAKVKSELPDDLIERAKDPEEPATKLRERVDLLLYHGSPDHSDGTPQSFVLVGGQKLIRAIKEKIQRLRPAVVEEGASAPASDAEVVDFALADCLAGVQEAEIMKWTSYGVGRRNGHETPTRIDGEQVREKTP
jgi:hypothetical protein